MDEGRFSFPQPFAGTKRLYTYDEFVAEFPETTQPCELWDGEVTYFPTPSFEHQQIVARITRPPV